MIEYRGILVFMLALFIGSLMLTSDRSLLRAWLTKTPAALCQRPATLVGAYGSMPKIPDDVDEICPGQLDFASNDLFRQGMLQLYGFNYDEARYNFEEVLRKDASCTLCHFGLAYTYHPHLNSQLEETKSRLGNAVVRSRLNLNPTCVLERRLLEAQLVLFNPSTWNTTAISDYRLALEQLVGPDSWSAPRLLRILLAESMMNESPWRYYADEGKNSQTRTRDTLRPGAAKAYGLLYEVVFGYGPTGGGTVKEEYAHPLALHLLIHLCEPSNEMTANPGLRVANLLSQAMNGSFTGHLVHMPAHIYTRLGLYSKSIESSQAAVKIDRQYVARCLSPYVPTHNVGLLVMAALYAGEEKIARQYAPGLVTISQVPELGLPAMEARAKYLTAVFPVPLEFVLTRFGRWTELKDSLAETDVERDPTLGAVDISAGELRLTLRDRALIQRPFHALSNKKPAFFLAMQQYVRSLQMIHQGHSQLDTAVAAMSQAANLIPHDDLPTSHVFYPNHFEIGQLMNATVHGAGLIRRNRFQEAVEILETAANLQESFLYMEPENWHVPIRHCVASANLAWAASLYKSSCSETKVKALEAVVQALEYDLLHHHLHDVWALNGLALANKGLSECQGSSNVRLSNPRLPPSPCCEVAGC